MKSRSNFFIFMGALAMLLLLSSCVEPLRTKGFDEKELYTVHFTLRTQDDAVLTKAGPISGADKVVNKLFMYCFDGNGRYLGRFPAEIKNAESLPYDNSDKYGTYEGQIPPATCRIHFVANADCPVGNDKIGLTEKEIMNAAGSDAVCSSTSSPMAYWGYLRRDTKEELASVLGSGNSIVYMVRDRLCIQAGSIDSKLKNVEWVVYNGLEHGYIASFGLKDGATVLDTDNPYQEVKYTLEENVFTLSTVVTPYVEEGGRFKTTEADLVPFNSDNPMYVFDDECPLTDASRVVKLIVKATYTPDDETQEVRYYPICITNGYDSEPIPLKRGHVYKLDLRAMPPAAGYRSFEGAADALSFANGAIVEIPGEVIEISDGRFDMKVKHELRYPLSRETFNSTAILLQSTKESEVLDFTIKKIQGNNEKFYFLESGWLTSDSETTKAHNSSSSVTWGDGIMSDTDPNTHKTGPVSTNTIGNGPDTLASSITLPLLPVGSDLKQSVFNLKAYYWGVIEGQAVKHILMRNIYVYTISQFQISGTPTLERIGTTDNYRLKFKLPSGNNAYPELLYPLQVKLASKTLEPYAISIGDGTATGQITQQNPVFGVQVRSTVGEPSGILAQSSTVKSWNYQEANNYWNFWYAYSVTSIPRYSSTNASEDHPVGEVIAGPEIWIDLKDIRDEGGFSQATRPDDVGLYLYIEFFGHAIPVTL